jgi:hypothetical protein
MTTAMMTTWIGPVLDVAAVLLLGAVLWRLGRDPGAAWSEREARLQAIFDDLRALVAQSEGLARELDGRLAGREERLLALLAEARELGTRPSGERARARAAKVETRDQGAERAPATPADAAATAARIETLADGGASPEDIARRLGVAVAEVRLVIGLKAARAARRKPAPGALAHA